VSGSVGVTQEKFRDDSPQRLDRALSSATTLYSRLEIPSTADTEQIRRAYRQKSKLYHPDTTSLHPKIATQKFNELNEAYAILSNPEHRMQYDLRLSAAVESRKPMDISATTTNRSKPIPVGNLDPKERPLSPGEMFALFILGLTFAVCLVLALILGLARGEMILQASLPTVTKNASSERLFQDLSQDPSRTDSSRSLKKSAIIEKDKALAARFSLKDSAGLSSVPLIH
jgi:curved DNA-binding protein CbpA